MSKKVIVIGAGIGGLSAAIRLQHQGYQVEIYEKMPIAGGKMHQLKVEGHTFDVGPTIVMWPEAYREIFTVTGADPDDYITMERLNPMYDVYFQADRYRHYQVSNDLVDIMALMESKDPKTALGFLQYLADIYERYQIANEHFIRQPFRNKSDIYNPAMLRNALRLKTFDSANNMMAKFIPNPDIQQMLSFQTLYIGVSPQKGPSLYTMIPMIELLYGIYFIKGGMYAMAQALVRRFEELGGIIHYQQDVDEIVIEQQVAKGIRIGDNIIQSDYVISNADFPYTMSQLVQDTKTRGQYTPQKIEQMDYSCSCLIFYWGVEGTFDNLQVHNFVISQDLDDNLTRIFDGRLVDNASLYLHIPSLADPSLAPEGKSSFYVLIPVSELKTASYEYNSDIIAHYRNYAFEMLSHLPGLETLSTQITVERVFTPNDFEEQFNAHYGATFGLQPTLKQSNHWRPQSKAAHCDNLYFTGSSTHPGAGVPVVLEGGRICADELILDNNGG